MTRKWLITMVIVFVPQVGLVMLLPNGFFMALIYGDDPK